MDKNVDESLIEATIRRVAEAQAAREAGPAPETPADVESMADAESADVPFGTPIAEEAEQAPGAAFGSSAGTLFDARPSEAAAEAQESAIEATIRRVAAAKAAREQEAPALASPAPEPGYAPEDPPAPVAAEPVYAPEEPQARVAPDALPVAVDPDPLTFTQRGHGSTALAFERAPEPEAWTDAVARIERGLDTANALLREIVARLGAGQTPRDSTRPSLMAAPPTNGASDDDWEDDTPRVQPMAFGAPPRPSILRDPPAVASQPAPEPEVIDARPLPAPLPPIQPDTRRGFDLLPRTYRITVEDKRRGVDLVPLHRALLAMDGVRDMSLLSYNNGVAIVSLETVNDVDTDVLRQAVSHAMSRPATVETHNERTLVVKLAEA